MIYTASPKHPRWVNLSNRHRLACESLESRLKGFFFGTELIPATAIVGPYGSGKTELMYWGFRYVWHELRRPAFYMNLETLLSLLPSDVAPNLLHDEVGKIIRQQIDTLRQILSGGQPAKPCLPGLEDKENLQDYFKQCRIDFDRVNEAIQSDEVVLFVDEMEQHYKSLRDRLKTSDLSSIRSFLERVEQKKQKPRFYVVMGFALGSAYEALGGAEARRKSTIPIPLPDPGEFVNLVKEEKERNLFMKYSNLFWWTSRGRPGWALPMWDSWGKYLEEAQRIDDEMIRRFFRERIEGLPYVDTSKINELITEANSEALKPLILRVQPIAKELFPVSSVEAVLDSLGFHYVFVSSSLIAVEKLLEALVSDLRKVPSSYAPDWMLLRGYLRRILVATSNSGKIAFGGWKSESEAFAKAAVAPMLLMLHDLVLEFEGDTDEGRKTWNFLHSLVADLKASDEAPDVHKILTWFGATRQLFNSYYDESQVAFIQPSSKLVEELFPRLVVKPLLMLNDNAKNDIESQRNHLEGAVESSGVFLEQSISVGDIRVRFIFIPSASCLSRLQDIHLITMERDAYLPYEQTIVILNLKQEDTLHLDYSKNSELRVLEEIGKLRTTQLEERELSDFIASLWHNLSVSGEDLLSDLLEILEELQEKVKKNTRRTVEYYTDLIHDRLGALAEIAAGDYKKKVSEVFLYRASDFPEHAIGDVVRRVEETRATEQVAVAFDIFLDRTRSLDTLASLRQMKRLSEMPKKPHGYKEFIGTYTVSLQKPPRPLATMDANVKFIKRYGSFGKLRDYAKDLSHDMGAMPAWLNLTERAANCPLEQMFGWSQQSRIFLRGLYFRVFLENHKNDLLREVSKLSASILDTGKRLKQLLKDIEDLNATLGKNVLSFQISKDIQQELEQASKLLEGRRRLPPGVLYVTFRFLNAAVEKVEEERQRWSGTTVGIEAWRSKLYDMIKLKEYEDGLNKRLQDIYRTNREFKEHEIGKVEGIFNREVAKLRAAADKVLSQLGTYELGEPVPDVDLNPFTEAGEEVERDITDDVDVKSQQVDEVCRVLPLVQSKLNNLYKAMTQ